jgi:hypothetical protein
VSIGINLPVFPQLVIVPGYPVYYAPRLDANYFFYDGMYWVYQDDNWYSSSWYNGPWVYVERNVVPLFILRVPVRYYRQPPEYFHGWQSNKAPHWGQRWGQEWEQHRKGWNSWKRAATPAAAPLPVYQRQYSGDSYPRGEQQKALHGKNYRYQSRDSAIKSPEHLDAPRPMPLQKGAPASPQTHPPQRGGEQVQKSAPDHQAPQQRSPAVQEQRQPPRMEQQHREQPQPPRMKEQEQRPQDRGATTREPDRDRGQGQKNDDERGRGRDK